MIVGLGRASEQASALSIPSLPLNLSHGAIPQQTERVGHRSHPVVS